jgi:hypothetical protein
MPVRTGARAPRRAALPARRALTLVSFSSLTSYAGFLYMLIALVSICYWMQGNAQKQEYEDNEREEAGLLSGSGERDGEEAAAN